MTRRETVERFIAACLAADETRAAECFSETGVFLEPDRGPTVGRAAIEAHFSHFFHSGPRWRWTIDEILESHAAAGDRCIVVYRFGIEGSNGEWREHEGCAIVSFDGTSIAQWREFRG